MSFWIFSDTEKKQESKKDFISLASHELRSPLSIIKWYTEILLDEDSGKLNEDQRKYLTTIEASNEQAIALVRSLLNVSRIDLGTFCIVPEHVSLDSCIKEACSALATEQERNHVSLSYEGTQDAKDVYLLDKKIVIFILKHLIANAIGFSHKKGAVRVSCRKVSRGEVIEETVIGEESVLVSVSDTGIGIPAADHARIGTQMFRAANVKKAETSGSGLGLYAIKMLLPYFGGTLFFVSEEDKGSTFYVTFPAKGMKEKDGHTTLDI